MNCPKCGAEVAQHSILCPKCHERIPGRELHQVAKDALIDASTKEQQQLDYENSQQHHWGMMLLSFMLISVIGLFCYRIGGDVIGKVKESSARNIQLSKENLETVCREGFKQLAGTQSTNYDQFQQDVDAYAQEHGMANKEMFFAMCGQFAGDLAKEVFQKRLGAMGAMSAKGLR